MPNFYDPKGELVGSTSPPGPSGGDLLSLILFAMVVGAVITTFKWVANWQSHSGVSQFAAAYYYFLVGLPLSLIPPIWSFFSSIYYTSYANLNFILQIVIGCGGVALYASILLAVVWATNKILKRFKAQPVWLLIVLGPGLFSLLWWLFFAVVGWLFAK